LSFAAAFAFNSPIPRCSRRRLRLYSSTSSPPSPEQNGPRIVVIGAGVGGLSVAGRLKRRLPDASITVLEQNEREAAGGRLGEYVWEGHRWETGPSLLLLPEVYEETFAAVGSGEGTGGFRALVNVVKVRRRAARLISSVQETHTHT
jgi:phytoene dehydrogenase-like protein